MMEKLGIPQTHLGLKEMIKQVDEDQDGKISFREVKKISFQIEFLFILFSFYLFFEKQCPKMEKLKMKNHRLHQFYNNFIQCLLKLM